jgi:acyl-coenzyme A thioesterase PaaI-like protein
MTDLQTVLRKMVPIYEHMDVQLEIPGDGTFGVRVPFHPAVKGHVGTVHAAFQWASAELLGGIVALATFGSLDDIFLVVREVTIRFTAPARSEITASCAFGEDRMTKLRQTIASEGEDSFALEMVIKDDAGEVVADMTADYLVRRRREQ